MATLLSAPIPYLGKTDEAVSTPDRLCPINPANSQPYSWICHLKIRMKSQAVYGGSGFWMNLPHSDVKCILTAGHNLFFGEDEYAERVEVTFPGQQQAFVASRSQLHVSKRWKDNLTKLDDFGAIIIQDTPKSCGGFGYSTVITNQQLLTTDATMFGYPVDKPYQTLWGTGGSICEVAPRQFMYTFGADRGQSGSPVYIWHKGCWTAVGIHLYEYQKDNKRTNCAKRLSLDNIQEILSWFEYPMFQKMLRAADSDQKLIKITKAATALNGIGSGLVIAGYERDKHTTLDFIPVESLPGNSLPSEPVTYAIASHYFPKTYIRLAGDGLFAKKKRIDGGEGTVNCQPIAQAWEFFNIIPDGTTSGKVSIQSFIFPGVFLRMDASHVSEDNREGGSDSVNAQWTAGSLECFELI